MTSVLRSGISIRLSHKFSASRERVFSAWTLADALKQWWCPDGWLPGEVEVDLRRGGAYRIGMCPKGMGTPVYVRGHFLEVVPPEKLVYTWRWENAFAQMPETRVTVEFLEANGLTEVTLVHEGLPGIPICLRHWNGWIAVWDRIERRFLS